MKKLISVLLVMTLALSLAACSESSSVSSSSSESSSSVSEPAASSSTDASSQTSSEASETSADSESSADSSSEVSETEDESTGNKTLVVYYSATGSTKAVAETIANTLGADLFEITPVEPYTSNDLDWTNDNSRVSLEHNDESKRDVPLTETTPENWEDYDTVFIGYPIWWAIAAWPVNNFVTGNDFTGKTVIPFCTSSSSGLGRSGELLADMAGTGDWLEGERFSSGASSSEIESWVNDLGIE